MPAKSKRLKVIDRIEDVLRAIQEGDDYWRSPKVVGKPSSRLVMGYPAYFVCPEPGDPVVMESDGQFEEVFYVVIEGHVIEEEDIVTPLEHAIQDVRKAIKNDTASGGGADSLGNLTTSAYPDHLFDIAYDKAENGSLMAAFKQRIRIQIYGEFGEL